MSDHDELDQLVRLLAGYRYNVGAEADFQAGLETVLKASGLVFQREHDLGSSFGRIDFYNSHLRIGIELKVKGSPSEVVRQLYRYSTCPAIGALVLITGRSRLAAMPKTLNGKPLVTISLWEGLL